MNSLGYSPSEESIKQKIKAIDSDSKSIKKVFN